MAAKILAPETTTGWVPGCQVYDKLRRREGQCSLSQPLFCVFWTRQKHIEREVGLLQVAFGTQRTGKYDHLSGGDRR